MKVACSLQKPESLRMQSAMVGPFVLKLMSKTPHELIAGLRTGEED